LTKRFYKRAAATEDSGQYTVLLDGRQVRTPGGAALALPTRRLAEAVAGEWEAQENEVRPLTMPMMRLAATAIDRIGKEREAITWQIAAYGGSDLLCYRAEDPDSLVERQASRWQPLLDWAAQTYGARLIVTHAVTPVSQDEKALASLRSALEGLDDFRLAAVSQLTVSSGSLVIALAVAAGRIDSGEAIAASQLDEEWQAEQWGHDSDAALRREGLAREIEDAERFLGLLER
jgi:chaperone required for assembly of F1-ATPase